MTRRMTKEKWINWQIKDFNKRIAFKYSETFKNDIRMPFTHTYGNYQIIITERLDMIILNTLTGKLSMAKNYSIHNTKYCIRYDTRLLFAYAWARYCNRPIPKFIERVDAWDLKVGDIIYSSSSNLAEPVLEESDKCVYLRSDEKALVSVYNLKSDNVWKIDSSIYKFYKEIDE